MKKSTTDILFRQYLFESGLEEKRQIITDPTDPTAPDVISGTDDKNIDHNNPKEFIQDQNDEDINDSFDELRRIIFNQNDEEDGDEQLDPDQEVQEDTVKKPGQEETDPETGEPINTDEVTPTDPTDQGQDPSIAPAPDLEDTPTQPDPNTQQDPNVAAGQMDPTSGMPMNNPNMGQMDPTTGMSPMNQDPNSMGQMDPATGMPINDPNAMGGIGGMPMEPNKPQTSSDVGRIYELKKIHSRLNAIDSYLGTMLDTNLEKIKSYVTKTIDMFNTVISNFDLFKEKIDDIIIQFYSFLQEIYAFLRDYFKDKDKTREELKNK